MSKSGTVTEISGFMRWAMEQKDPKLLAASARFLDQLFIFSKMGFGGHEYTHQQTVLQEFAADVVHCTEKINYHIIPMAMLTIAAPRGEDEMILNLAQQNASVACELLDLEPLDTCPSPCYCATSSAPLP
jgi:hypothetical protein